jgi:hypothetical protein
MPTRTRLWAITCYFNPARYRSRLANYRRFRKRLSVPLVCVELSFGDPFDLERCDAEVLVQLRGGDVLWQKERLLNVALQSVPADCDRVAWLDADVTFEREDWADGAHRLLERFPLAQLYQRVQDLGPAPSDDAPGEAIGPVSLSMSQRVSAGAMTDEQLCAPGRLGCSGLAWAARREVLESGGFYDACIVGSGDRAMALAAYGRFDLAVRYLHMSELRAAHYRAWARRFFDAVRGNVGCLAGGIRHFWHGDAANRGYVERHRELCEFDFDPTLDIAQSENGCWRWSSAKHDMHEFVRGYFQTRREDG